MDLDISPRWFTSVVEELRRVSKRSKRRQFMLLIPVEEYFTRVVSGIGREISIIEIISGMKSVNNFIFEAVKIITNLREANYEELDINNVVPNFTRSLETLVPHLIRTAKDDSGKIIQYTSSLFCCFLAIATANRDSWFYSTIISTSCMYILYTYNEHLSEKQKETLGEHVLCYLTGLVDAVQHCGDYSCQLFLLAVIFHLVKLQQIDKQREIISKLFPNLTYEDHNNLLIDESPNYSTLLNGLNLSQSENLISSIAILNLCIGELNVIQYSKRNEHWINFSHNSKRVNFKVDLRSSPVPEQLDVNIELSNIESVCISQVKDPFSGVFYVLHVRLNTNIASIANELQCDLQIDANCRSFHVALEEDTAVKDALERLQIDFHDFDRENEHCCYPEQLWSTLLNHSDMLDVNGASMNSPAEGDNDEEYVEDEAVESGRNEELENLSPRGCSIDNGRSFSFKENEIPPYYIPNAVFMQRPSTQCSPESQEIYPATPNGSDLGQPYSLEDRNDASDNEAVPLTSTTVESCHEDPFPRSLRRNFMQGSELGSPISSIGGSSPDQFLATEPEIPTPPQSAMPLVKKATLQKSPISIASSVEHSPDQYQLTVNKKSISPPSQSAQSLSKKSTQNKSPTQISSSLEQSPNQYPLTVYDVSVRCPPEPPRNVNIIASPTKSPIRSSSGLTHSHGQFPVTVQEESIIPSQDHTKLLGTKTNEQKSPLRQAVPKVQKKILCYSRENIENVFSQTQTQGQDPYIPRCIRKEDVGKVTKPRRSRPTTSKIKTVCRPLPVRRVPTKVAKKRKLEQARKKVVRLENKIEKLQTEIDQLEIVLAVAKEELLEEERAASADKDYIS